MVLKALQHGGMLLEEEHAALPTPRARAAAAASTQPLRRGQLRSSGAGTRTKGAATSGRPLHTSTAGPPRGRPRAAGGYTAPLREEEPLSLIHI
eukprot:14177615-Alexandrium_andersonii.AAC.1